MTPLEEIIENFSFLDDWEDRYGYLIELGNALPSFPEADMTEANRVQGCVSQVWLTHRVDDGHIHFAAMSDAHIVRGLVAVALAIFSGRSAQDILSTSEEEVFSQIGLQEHITPQRANGLRALVARMKSAAQAELQTN